MTSLKNHNNDNSDINNDNYDEDHNARAPSPQLRTHARNPSSFSTSEQSDSSGFSQVNPLPPDFDQTLPTRARDRPNVPFVAKTGWSRTVFTGDEPPSPPNITLGAPGTGLSKAALATEKALGPTVGHKARDHQASSSRSLLHSTAGDSASWAAKVTADDLVAADSLRKVGPPEGAVPLPPPRSPRCRSENEASESVSVMESPRSTARRRRGTNPSSPTTSSASSDLNFLVAPLTGSFFGTRATVGRAVDPRMPSTAGEATLHNNLAKYLGHEPGENGSYASVSGGGRDLPGRGVSLPNFGQRNLERPNLDENFRVASSVLGVDFSSFRDSNEKRRFDSSNGGLSTRKKDDNTAGGEGDATSAPTASTSDEEEQETKHAMKNDGRGERSAEQLKLEFYSSMEAAEAAARTALSRSEPKTPEDNGKRGLVATRGSWKSTEREKRGERGVRGREDGMSSDDYGRDEGDGGSVVASSCSCARWPWKV
ncbi:unnamed protein product, partial [Sphacelaria rigidula]